MIGKILDKYNISYWWWKNNRGRNRYRLDENNYIFITHFPLKHYGYNLTEAIHLKEPEEVDILKAINKAERNNFTNIYVYSGR